MFKSKLILGCAITILLIVSENVIGQDQDSTLNILTPKEEIIKLSESTILIRLNSQKKRLEYQKKFGSKKQIQKLEEQIHKEQSEIINGAEEHLKFCSFYFFYSHDSDAIIKKKNYSLLFDSEKKPLTEAEYPTTTYLLSLEKPSWFSQIDSYFFILYGIDKKGIRKLKKPMPYAFRTKSGKLFTRYDFNKAMEKLNKRLVKFHFRQMQIEEFERQW